MPWTCHEWGTGPRRSRLRQRLSDLSDLLGVLRLDHFEGRFSQAVDGSLHYRHKLTDFTLVIGHGLEDLLIELQLKLVLELLPGSLIVIVEAPLEVLIDFLRHRHLLLDGVDAVQRVLALGSSNCFDVDLRLVPDYLGIEQALRGLKPALLSLS